MYIINIADIYDVQEFAQQTYLAIKIMDRKTETKNIRWRPIFRGKYRRPHINWNERTNSRMMQKNKGEEKKSQYQWYKRENNYI